MLPEKSRKMMTAVPGDVAAALGDESACVRRITAGVIARWSAPGTTDPACREAMILDGCLAHDWGMAHSAQLGIRWRPPLG